MITNPPAGHRLTITRDSYPRCQCGFLLRFNADHERHVFAVVWAQGFDAGERDVFEHERTDNWDLSCTPNPYEVES